MRRDSLGEATWQRAHAASHVDALLSPFLTIAAHRPGPTRRGTRDPHDTLVMGPLSELCPALVPGPAANRPLEAELQECWWDILQLIQLSPRPPPTPPSFPSPHNGF